MPRAYSAQRSRRIRPCHRSPRISPTCCIATGDMTRRRKAYERAAKLSPDLGDDLYFKLGNIAYKRRETARARESWSRATALNPGHELARTNLEMLDMTP